MTRDASNRPSGAEVLALRGLRLPAVALQQLRRTGIFCDPAVSVEYQSGVRRYVIRGVESGGSVGELGAYCSYVSMDGNPLPWLQKIDTVGRNGLHAVVIAPAMVRIQMFRYGDTCELLVTEHQFESVETGSRSRLRSTLIFHGIHGAMESSGAATNYHGSVAVLPVFYKRSGEVRSIPEGFVPAVEKISLAVRCAGCKHCHLLEPARNGDQREVGFAGKSGEVVSL